MTDKSSINRASLLAAANLVRPALAAQAYLPALTHIRFQLGWATAYNDVSAIMVRSPLDIDRCLPGDLLIRALGSFGGESIMLQEGKDGSLVVKSGRSQIKLPTLAAADFPFKLPDEAAPEVVLDNAVLKGITRCLLNVGSDPTHPAQMGVTLDMDDDGHAVLYSTDNSTISRYQTQTKVKLPAGAPVIMPTFFCEQLVSLSKSFPEDDVVLVLLDGALLVEFGKAARLFSKTLVDLTPLDFPKMLAKHVGAGVRDELFPIPDSFDSSLGRALLVLSGEVDKFTKITLGEGLFKMHSESAMGDSDDTLECDGDLTGGPDSFYVDPSLLTRAAKHCALIGFLPKVVVLSDEGADFVHMIAHCMGK